jgi:twitching motility protein PilT
MNQNEKSGKDGSIELTEADRSSSTSSQVDIRNLVKALLKFHASDLHLSVGRPPLYRINGKLIPAKMPEITKEKAESIIFSFLTPRQISDLEVRKQIDLSFHIEELGRFRCNVYYQKNSLSVAVRMIPYSISSLEQLGVPMTVLKEFCHHKTGLVLVTGPTGSGKSTTLAAMVQYINNNEQVHILTIEDPIEYIHRDVKALITQREIGSDALSMKEGLIGGLRQDPDVIMIGEMRDIETIQAALTAAETGHLVLATLHTNDAKSSIDRIIDVFPHEARNQIRIQLSNTLMGVVSQRLVPRADGSGRIPACEVMVKSPAIEGYILRNELERIDDAIANSNAYYKMQTMNQALEKLVKSSTIHLEEAVRWSPNPDDLKLRIAGVDRSQGYD